MPALAFSGLGKPPVEHDLDAGEQLAGNQWFVTARIVLAPVSNQANVVPVAQDTGEVFSRYRPGDTVDLWTHPQSALGQHDREPGHRIVAGRAQLNGEPDQRRSVLVDSDRPYLVPINPVADIFVTDLCPG
jgi:hypothetical protein